MSLQAYRFQRLNFLEALHKIYCADVVLDLDNLDPMLCHRNTAEIVNFKLDRLALVRLAWTQGTFTISLYSTSQIDGGANNYQLTNVGGYYTKKSYLNQRPGNLFLTGLPASVSGNRFRATSGHTRFRQLSLLRPAGRAGGGKAVVVVVCRPWIQILGTAQTCLLRACCVPAAPAPMAHLPVHTSSACRPVR